jgi:hypothetical protein
MNYGVVLMAIIVIRCVLANILMIRYKLIEKLLKKWFNSQLDIWGGNAIKVINPWIKENQEIVDIFVSEFVILYNEFAKKLGLDKL